MQTEVKISDVLHLAADEYLAKDSAEACNIIGKVQYSCDAVQLALDDLLSYNWYNNEGIHARIIQGLGAMGCECGSLLQFIELETDLRKSFNNCTPESQAARYFWLKWAALQAEIQGE